MTQNAIEKHYEKKAGLSYRKFMLEPSGPVMFFHGDFQ